MKKVEEGSAIQILKHDELSIRDEIGIVLVRQKTRSFASEIGLGLTDQTKAVTAASEIARNTFVYGGGGVATVEILADKGRTGLRLIFEDKGPGIPDINQALTDGYTSGGGLGLGLGGAKRLVSEFEIHSRVGEGTRIVLTKWK